MWLNKANNNTPPFFQTTISAGAKRLSCITFKRNNKSISSPTETKSRLIYFLVCHYHKLNWEPRYATQILFNNSRKDT